MINSYEEYAYVHIQRFITLPDSGSRYLHLLHNSKVLQRAVDRSFKLLAEIPTPGWASYVLIKWKLLKGS